MVNDSPVQYWAITVYSSYGKQQLLAWLLFSRWETGIEWELFSASWTFKKKKSSCLSSGGILFWLFSLMELSTFNGVWNKLRQRLLHIPWLSLTCAWYVFWGFFCCISEAAYPTSHLMWLLVLNLWTLNFKTTVTFDQAWGTSANHIVTLPLTNNAVVVYLGVYCTHIHKHTHISFVTRGAHSQAVFGVGWFLSHPVVLHCR